MVWLCWVCVTQKRLSDQGKMASQEELELHQSAEDLIDIIKSNPRSLTHDVVILAKYTQFCAALSSALTACIQSSDEKMLDNILTITNFESILELLIQNNCQAEMFRILLLVCLV